MITELFGSDFFSILLPFLFVMVVIYGGISLTGKFDKRVNIILSLVLAGFAVMNEEVVEFIYAVLPYAAIFFILLFFVSFFRKMGKDNKIDYSLLGIIATIVIIFITSRTEFGLLEASDDLIAIMVLAAIALIFIAAFKTKKE